MSDLKDLHKALRVECHRPWWPVVADIIMTMFIAMLLVAGAVIFFTGCIHMPHTQPELRAPTTASASVVRLDYSCGDDAFGQHTTWGMGHATGVVINDRTVLTAGHVVRCPSIPVVTVTTYDGRRFAFVVARDELSFGDGRDIARLAMASGSVLGLRLGPPVIAHAEEGDAVAVYTLHGELRGTVRDSHGNVELREAGFIGDSGAPVIRSDGALVGILVHGNDEITSKFIQFEPVLTKDVP